MYRRTLDGTLCYPGTSIPLIRGGAPDPATPAPGGDGGGKPAAQPAAQPGGDPKAAAPAAPARNWEKDYGELEARFKPYETRFRHPAENRALSADEIEQGLNWAREIKRRVDSGEFVEKSKIQQAQQITQTQADPYEDWDNLSGKEQRALLKADLARELREEIGNPLQQRFDEFGRNVMGNQQLMLRLMEHKVKHPNVDMTELLSRANEMLLMKPEQLMERALDSILAPDARKREVDQAVEAEVARREQERTNKEIKNLSPRPSLRLAASKPGTGREKRDEAFGKFLAKARSLASNE